VKAAVPCEKEPYPFKLSSMPQVMIFVEMLQSSIMV